MELHFQWRPLRRRATMSSVLTNQAAHPPDPIPGSETPDLGPLSTVDLSEATDEALVRAARLCDDVAFSVLVDRHGPALLQFARRMMDDEHEAVDAVQETFISAWRGLPGYRGKSAFRTWLYSLLHRRVVDLHRVRRPVPIDDQMMDAFHRPSTDDPLQHLLGVEQMAALDVALHELPWNQRAA